MTARAAQECRRGLARRFLTYQAERFPFAQHGLLIGVFTFSAASYSRICRGVEGFVAPPRFATGVVTAVLFFFLLRIADEFKDYQDDARYRPYRAVPRGLISLGELGAIGVGVIAFQVLLNAVLMPVMLIPLALVLLYMGLMRAEFFVPAWLKRHPLTYMASHMVIMPLIDFYTTGLDWLVAGVSPPRGVEIFLVVSFFNGMVIEIGRKIRAPEAEETGVETYSSLYGPRGGSALWLGSVFTTYACALAASLVSGFGAPGFAMLTALLVLCAGPGVLFMATRRQSHAKLIETAAGVWTMGMYLILGATPMIVRTVREMLAKL